MKLEHRALYYYYSTVQLVCVQLVAAGEKSVRHKVVTSPQGAEHVLSMLLQDILNLSPPVLLKCCFHCSL